MSSILIAFSDATEGIDFTEDSDDSHTTSKNNDSAEPNARDNNVTVIALSIGMNKK